MNFPAPRLLLHALGGGCYVHRYVVKHYDRIPLGGRRKGVCECARLGPATQTLPVLATRTRKRPRTLAMALGSIVPKLAVCGHAFRIS